MRSSGSSGAQISGSQQNMRRIESVDQAGAVVCGFEIEHVLAEHVGEPGVAEDEVRALGAAHQPLVAAERALDLVGPGTGRIHDQPRSQADRLVGDLVAQDDVLAFGPAQSDIGEGRRPCGQSRSASATSSSVSRSGWLTRCVVVLAHDFRLGCESGQALAGEGGAQETVARHRARLPAEAIVGG